MIDRHLSQETKETNSTPNELLKLERLVDFVSENMDNFPALASSINHRFGDTISVSTNAKAPEAQLTDLLVKSFEVFMDLIISSKHLESQEIQGKESNRNQLKHGISQRNWTSWHPSLRKMDYFSDPMNTFGKEDTANMPTGSPLLSNGSARGNLHSQAGFNQTNRSPLKEIVRKGTNRSHKARSRSPPPLNQRLQSPRTNQRPESQSPPPLENRHRHLNCNLWERSRLLMGSLNQPTSSQANWIASEEERAKEFRRQLGTQEITEEITKKLIQSQPLNFVSPGLLQNQNLPDFPFQKSNGLDAHSSNGSSNSYFCSMPFNSSGSNHFDNGNFGRNSSGRETRRSFCGKCGDFPLTSSFCPKCQSNRLKGLSEWVPDDSSAFFSQKNQDQMNSGSSRGAVSQMVSRMAQAKGTQ